MNKFISTVEINVLENFLRDDLNKHSAPPRMGVLRPIKLVLTNYPAGQIEELDAVNNPEDAVRRNAVRFRFGREPIEQEDFAEVPPPKYFRLFPGNEVRIAIRLLREMHRCRERFRTEKSPRFTAPTTQPPAAEMRPDGRKVKSTIHWVSAEKSLPAEVRLYDRFPQSAIRKMFLGVGIGRRDLNPNSLEFTFGDARVEPSMKGAGGRSIFQFERRPGISSVDKEIRRLGSRTGVQSIGLVERHLGEGIEKSGRLERSEAPLPLAASRINSVSNDGPGFREAASGYCFTCFKHRAIRFNVRSLPSISKL